MEDRKTSSNPWRRVVGLDEAGAWESPTIVLIHAVGLSRRMWRPQLELMQDEFHVLAPDLPGHGAHTSAAYHLDEAVEEIRTLLDRTVEYKACLVGESIGGYVALAVASREPEKVAGLVLSSSSHNLPPRMAMRARLMVGPLRRAFLTLGGEAYLARKIMRRARKQYDKHIAHWVRAGGLRPRAIADSLSEFVHVDFLSQLEAVDCPVLALNGARDRFLRSPAVDILPRAKQARREIVGDAGHMISLDQPELFAELVGDFARDLDW
jgi:pimeloyl-ACP methyl ester carboxylesterase